jgi:hypothetical protein
MKKGGQSWPPFFCPPIRIEAAALSLFLDISIRIGNIKLKFQPSSQRLPSGGDKMRKKIRSIYDPKQEIDGHLFYFLNGFSLHLEFLLRLRRKEKRG